MADKIRDEVEINDMLDRTYDEISKIDAGESRGNFGMTYEDGVKNALEWVNNYTDEDPIEGD